MRAAIIGCGKIADHHFQAVRRIADCSVVAACDRELLMAQQFAERFRVPSCFTDVGEMLRAASVDVVHITTPPQSHYDLAVQCLEAGKHVYLEKPFTVDASEAEALVSLANRLSLRITAGHNYQFTPEMIEMRRLVGEGFLGGSPVHLESHWSYDLEDISYVGPILSNRSHWVRTLPGSLLHNLLSHGIARLVEFLDDDIEEVSVLGFQSPRMKRAAAPDILDELRVAIRDGAGTTAFFCFTTQVKPAVNRFALYGTGGSLTVDLLSGSVLRHIPRAYKSYLTFVIPPVNAGIEHMRNGIRNAIGIACQNIYQDSGIKELIERFYRSIHGGEPPISGREVIATARLMDQIFSRLSSNRE